MTKCTEEIETQLSTASLKHYSVQWIRQLLTEILNFPIQLNKATDVSNSTHFTALACYPWDGHIAEDFCFVQRYLEEKQVRRYSIYIIISWAKQSSNGRTALPSAPMVQLLWLTISGVVARIKTISPQIVTTHCMLHRKALTLKDMAPELHTVFSTAVHDMVNYVKSRPLQSQLFVQLINKMDAGHDTLLFQSEVQLLSHGEVLQWVFELYTELWVSERCHAYHYNAFFLTQSGQPRSPTLPTCSTYWMNSFYLSNVAMPVSWRSMINHGLQGKNWDLEYAGLEWDHRRVTTTHKVFGH